ncbi:glycoside hydrolase [Penicillium malachiteum]|uniref:glycoside hydrolase n=1 Tax=Penicillium malachiteum TaxID=1324776 RepID=UPI002548D5DA|nr:glycoside hydrolase [Penicillium malachiteum]KAJ5726245.1 glycoside hydrolase [Penicillium malachiteum]
MGIKKRDRSVTSLCVPLFFLLFFVTSVYSQNCSKDNPCSTGCCSTSGWCGTGDDHCGAGNCVDTCDFKLDCDASNPCETGCCSNAGYCGLGPDFCGADVCVSGCDSKAECDPGFGAEWATSSKCPLNVCCSDYCGNKTVEHTSCDKSTSTLDRVVGYYEAWASRRPCNVFWPEQIPLGIYTHINFAFAAIDPDTFEVRPDQTEDLDLLKRVTQLKTLDPDLKVMIALGGWTFNDPGPTQSTFSDIARSTDNQAKFFSSLISFLSSHNLDGVDLDWEYPAADDRNGRADDYENFPSFIANLKSALSNAGGRDELSITLPSSYWYLQHFDIAKLAPHVSFFNVMSYDLHGKWDLGNEWTGAYLSAHTNVTEIDKSLELLWRNNIDSSKVVLGLAFYARAYTLSDPNCVEPGCEFASGANKGQCSREVGILLNSEIDEIVADKELESTFYSGADVQVLHWDDQWLSYDDAKTLQLKTEYARGLCLGGVMVWAISHDTKDAKYSMALGDVSNRTSTSVTGLFQRKSTSSGSDDDDDTYVNKTTDHLQCTWSNCGEYCPAGWQMMTRDDKWKHTDGEIMLDDTACTSPHARRLCCPPSETAPSCGWYSFKGGACDGECPSGYSEVGSLGHGCRSGYQAACCTTENSDSKLLNSTRLFETCAWSDAPYCTEGKCTFAGSAWPTDFVESTTGSGAAVCNIDVARSTWDSKDHMWNYKAGKRKYCCDTSNDDITWGTCTWRDDIENFGTKGKKCSSNCKSNEIKVAMEGGDDCYGKNGGAMSYSCTGVYKTSQKVLNSDFTSWDDDISAWVDNPTCEDTSSSVLSTRSQEMRRDQIVLGKSTPYNSVLTVLTAILINAGSETISSTVLGYKKIFDAHVPKHEGWESLTSDNIVVWFDLDTNPTAAEVGPKEWAERILCSPDGYNAMLDSTTNSHPICDHFDLTSNDYDAADGSSDTVDDGTLIKRWTQARRALSELEKRSPAQDRTIHCNDGKTTRTVRYQSQPYPSVGQWPNDADQVENARDLRDWNHCHTSQTSIYNLGVDRNNYASMFNLRTPIHKQEMPEMIE